MRNLEARQRLDQQRKVMYRVLGRITGVEVFALGALSVLSGAAGLDFWGRFFTGRWFHVNDAVVGAAMLVLGWVLLRLTRLDPAVRWRSIRDWRRKHWISLGLNVTGLLFIVALIETRPLLIAWSAWIYYGLLSA